MRERWNQPMRRLKWMNSKLNNWHSTKWKFHWNRGGENFVEIHISINRTRWIEPYSFLIFFLSINSNKNNGQWKKKNEIHFWNAFWHISSFLGFDSLLWLFTNGLKHKLKWLKSRISKYYFYYYVVICWFTSKQHISVHSTQLHSSQFMVCFYNRSLLLCHSSITWKPNCNGLHLWNEFFFFFRRLSNSNSVFVFSGCQTNCG